VCVCGGGGRHVCWRFVDACAKRLDRGDRCLPPVVHVAGGLYSARCAREPVSAHLATNTTNVRVWSTGDGVVACASMVCRRRGSCAERLPSLAHGGDRCFESQANRRSGGFDLFRTCVGARAIERILHLALVKHRIVRAGEEDATPFHIGLIAHGEAAVAQFTPFASITQVAHRRREQALVCTGVDHISAGKLIPSRKRPGD